MEMTHSSRQSRLALFFFTFIIMRKWIRVACSSGNHRLFFRRMHLIVRMIIYRETLHPMTTRNC